MCRILFINKTEKFQPQEVLTSFATMCQNSPDPSGDWQGDGWGIAWLDKHTSPAHAGTPLTEEIWQVQKSTDPIWLNSDQFGNIPESTTFLVHARSKSFSENEINIDHNQPYINNNLAFAFNGTLRGVQIRIEGEIGAQKIFNLVQRFYKDDLGHAIEKTKQQLELTTKELLASNIVISDGKNVYALCNHSGKYPEYHTMYYSQTKEQTLVCSSPIDIANNWQSMRNGELIKFGIR